MFSAGKDSTVLLRLAEKAFYPGKIPMPLLHVDTGFEFQEMYDFRDQMVAELGVELIVHRNEQALSDGANPFDLGTQRCCGLLRTTALVDILKQHQFDAALGGARRDEERARAKERVFSFRNKLGQWDPRNQRPEMWSLYNGRINPGESMRVFPISNWTELDIWHYIHLEQIPIVPLYFAARHTVVERNGMLIPIHDPRAVLPGEQPKEVQCRYRTLGCTPCTGAVHSSATTVKEILQEMLDTRVSERITRIIDHDTDGSMEIKKREGYF
jgi:sulfate adenylyltransferase subunit 2